MCQSYRSVIWISDRERLRHVRIPGGTQHSLIQGGSASRSDPFPFTISDRKGTTTSVYPQEKWYSPPPPFIPSLELCIPAVHAQN